MKGIIMINAILGILSIFLGYQIKFKKKSSFINNYNSKSITDEKSYLNWIGCLELTIGSLILLITLVGYIIKSVLLIAFMDVLLIVIFISLLVLVDKKYIIK